MKQRWSSTLTNFVLSRRTFIDVVSTLAKQRWSNVYRITLIQRRWTNIVVSTLKFGWNWKLSRRMFNWKLSRRMLTKQRWNNIERITSIQCRLPVVSTLIFGWKWKLNQLCWSTLPRRCKNSIETTLPIVALICTDVH